MKREAALKVAKPILFNTEMVRVIQSGRKTATRRVVKSKNVDLNTCSFVEMSMNPSELRIDRNGMEYPHDLKGLYATFGQDGGEYFPLVKAPYEVGDILYVRETWCKLTDWEEQYPDSEDNMQIVYYKSDYPADMWDMAKWRPSIHMPKEAARIFLRVINVRVEHLQDIMIERISELLHEGIYQDTQFNSWFTWGDGCHNSSPIDCFKRLWKGTVNKSDVTKYGWAANPWVWVIEFEKMEVETS